MKEYHEVNCLNKLNHHYLFNKQIIENEKVKRIPALFDCRTKLGKSNKYLVQQLITIAKVTLNNIAIREKKKRTQKLYVPISWMSYQQTIMITLTTKYYG